MAKIIIPTPLRKFTKQTATIDSSAGNVLTAIEDLAKQFPGLQQHLFDSEGNIRSFIRIFVGDDDIQLLDNEKTIIKEDTVVSIVPAIAGGIK